MSWFSSKSETDKQVEQATNELLLGPDWGKNVEIWDLINQNQANCKDAYKTILKRLSHKNPKVVLLVLELLESCMKNCGKPFHILVNSKDLMSQMEKIAKTGSLEAQEKSLELIQAWAKSFERMSLNLPLYQATYMKLLTAGMKFPPYNPEAAPPIFTPQVFIPVDTAPPLPPAPQRQQQKASPHGRGGAQRPVTQESSNSVSPVNQTEKIRADLMIVTDNIQVLSCMVGGCKSVEELASDDIISNLVDNIQEMHRRIVNLINRVDEESVLMILLSTADEVVSALEIYDKMLTGAIPLSSFPGIASPPVASSTRVAAPLINISRPSQQKSGNDYDLLSTATSLSTPASSSLFARIGARTIKRAGNNDDFVASTQAQDSRMLIGGVPDARRPSFTMNDLDSLTQFNATKNAAAFRRPRSPSRVSHSPDRAPRPDSAAAAPPSSNTKHYTPSTSPSTSPSSTASAPHRSDSPEEFALPPPPTSADSKQKAAAAAIRAKKQEADKAEALANGYISPFASQLPTTSTPSFVFDDAPQAFPPMEGGAASYSFDMSSAEPVLYGSAEFSPSSAPRAPVDPLDELFF